MDKFLFNGYALYRGKIIYKDYQSGLLCWLDTSTGNINYIEDLKNYRIEMTCFDCMLECRNKLYAMENNGSSMMIYNETDGVCRWISLNCGIRAWGNFTNAFCYGDFLYFFHRKENWITCYNLTSDVVEKLEYEAGVFSICSCRIGNKVWIFPKDGNEIHVFDLDKRICVMHELEISLENVIACASDREKIYLLQNFGLVYVLKQSDLSVEVINFSMGVDMESVMGRILCVSNKLILLPATGNDIQIIDLDKRNIRVYTDYPKDFMYDDILWSKYYTICQDDKYYYLLRKSNYLLKINKEDGCFSWIKLKSGDEKIREKLKYKFDYLQHTVVEGKYNINALIEKACIIEINHTKEIEFVGKKIWREL